MHFYWIKMFHIFQYPEIDGFERGVRHHNISHFNVISIQIVC